MLRGTCNNEVAKVPSCLVCSGVISKASFKTTAYKYLHLSLLYTCTPLHMEGTCILVYTSTVREKLLDKLHFVIDMPIPLIP